jgi:hypothetical protein
MHLNYLAIVVAAVAVLVASTVWALGLALATWIAFPVVLLTGSVHWENVPWRLAAIHTGDWLIGPSTLVTPAHTP